MIKSSLEAGSELRSEHSLKIELGGPNGARTMVYWHGQPIGFLTSISLYVHKDSALPVVDLCFARPTDPPLAGKVTAIAQEIKDSTPTAAVRFTDGEELRRSTAGA